MGTPREKPHSLVRDGNRKSLQAITKQFGDGFLHDLDDLSRSPLHVAAIEGQLEILKFLVDRGQSMEACDNNGWTPLHHACHTGHMECAIYLLAAGADPWAVTFDNETVLHFLLPNHHLKENEIYRSVVMKILSRPEEIINLCDGQGNTVLHSAVSHDFLWTARQLLIAKCNPNPVNKVGETPLHLAAKSNNQEMVELLLEFKASPDLRTEAGRPIDYLGKSSGSRIRRTLVNASSRGSSPRRAAKSTKRLMDRLEEADTKVEQVTEEIQINLRPRARSHSSRSTRSLSRGGSRNESLLETLLTRSAIVHHEQETLQSKDKSLNKSTSQPQAIANAAKKEKSGKRASRRNSKRRSKKYTKEETREGSYSSNDGEFVPVILSPPEERICDVDDALTEKLTRSTSQRITQLERIRTSETLRETVSPAPLMVHEEVPNKMKRKPLVVDPVQGEQKITANHLFEVDEDVTDDSDETQLHYMERQLNQAQSKVQQLENELRMTQNLLRKTQRRLGERDRRINELERVIWRKEKAERIIPLDFDDSL